MADQTDIRAAGKRAEAQLARARTAFAALPESPPRATLLALAAQVVEARETLASLRADIRSRLLSRRRHAQPQKAYAQAARLAPPTKGVRP